MKNRCIFLLLAPLFSCVTSSDSADQASIKETNPYQCRFVIHELADASATIITAAAKGDEHQALLYAQAACLEHLHKQPAECEVKIQGNNYNKLFAVFAEDMQKSGAFCETGLDQVAVAIRNKEQAEPTVLAVAQTDALKTKIDQISATLCLKVNFSASQEASEADSKSYALPISDDDLIEMTERAASSDHDPWMSLAPKTGDNCT